MREDTRWPFAAAGPLLKRDVAEVLGRLAGRPAADELGVSHQTLMEWRAEGWLRGKWRADVPE